MTLSLDTAYRSFGGEVEASSTPTICRLPDSRRHQLWAIAHSLVTDSKVVFCQEVPRKAGKMRRPVIRWQPLCAGTSLILISVRIDFLNQIRCSMSAEQGASQSSFSGMAKT